MRSGVERMSSTRIESGSAVAREGDAGAGDGEAEGRGDQEAEGGRLDGDDRRLREDRQDLEGEGPVPDHAARPRARPRAARCSAKRMPMVSDEREHEVDRGARG